MKDITQLKNLDFEPRDEKLLTLSLSTTPLPPPLPTQELPPPPPQPPTPSPPPNHQNGPNGAHHPPPPPLPPPNHQNVMNGAHHPPPSPPNHPNGLNGAHHPLRPPRARGPPAQNIRPGKSETVPAPYPWATTHRAKVHPLKYLLSNAVEIKTISGELYCKKCDKQFEIQYDLEEKFREVALFISANKAAMHDRAPPSWMNPSFPTCIFCQQPNSAKPVIKKKRSINWLFLFLGQMLGFCKLNELKYFCKHTGNHRTGAKDRVLYLTYLELCNQVDPEGTFV